jgi:hypothetical protein
MSELSISDTCRPTGTPSSLRDFSLPSGKKPHDIVRDDDPPALVTVRAVCWPTSLYPYVVTMSHGSVLDFTHPLSKYEYDVSLRTV